MLVVILLIRNEEISWGLNYLDLKSSQKGAKIQREETLIHNSPLLLTNQSLFTIDNYLHHISMFTDKLKIFFF